MGTECYAMVRGSAIRVTGLTDKGRVSSPAQFATSKSVAKVTVTEVTESAASEVLSTPELTKRIRLQRSAQTIRHRVDIEFLRVDPGVLSLVAGVQLVYAAGPGAGFGEAPFGVVPLGSPGGEVVGFDSGTRLPTVGFALEVWSKLDQRASQPVTETFGYASFGDTAFGVGKSSGGSGFDELPFDEGPYGGGGIANPECLARRWGYTVFPYLRGGRLSGFTFQNGLVSFNLVGAQTRRVGRWGVGPHDLEGPFRRLFNPVSRNTSYRTQIISGAPPVQTDGVMEALPDVLDNGTAANPLPDLTAPAVVDGGGAQTEAWIIDGGRAE